MSAEHLGVKFEIGHVLFIDIVGYSKLLVRRLVDYCYGHTGQPPLF
jgi:hypothetical protein